MSTSKVIESSEKSAAAIDALEVTLVYDNQACEVVPSVFMLRKGLLKKFISLA